MCIAKYPAIDRFMADTHLWIGWIIQCQTGGNNLRWPIQAKPRLNVFYQLFLILSAMMSRLMTSLKGYGMGNIIPVRGYVEIRWTIAFDFSTNGGVASIDTASNFSQ
ncbi:MAG: hypothetical protein APR55_03725 [Methanolinea sp. SDB]|nr:MAG: hypothetical protein APR55_03725 [Methanolinea sp. SDB]